VASDLTRMPPRPGKRSPSPPGSGDANPVLRLNPSRFPDNSDHDSLPPIGTRESLRLIEQATGQAAYRGKASIEETETDAEVAEGPHKFG
jgi:hypothetical protein